MSAHETPASIVDSTSGASQRTSQASTSAKLTSTTILPQLSAVAPSSSVVFTSQIPSPSPARTGSPSRVALIAAPTASASAIILLFLAFFLYRRRRSAKTATQAHPFLCRRADSGDAETARKYSAPSAPPSPMHHTYPVALTVEQTQTRASAGSSFVCVDISAKPPHYNYFVPTHGSGPSERNNSFLQDTHCAVVPVVAEDLTPHSSAPTLLLRAHSNASTISSLYSRESMLPDVDSPPPPHDFCFGPPGAAVVSDVVMHGKRDRMYSPQNLEVRFSCAENASVAHRHFF